MKENRTLRNIAIALGVFVLWGNVVSLILPPEQYSAIIKTVDAATLLFVLVFLGFELFGKKK